MLADGIEVHLNEPLDVCQIRTLFGLAEGWSRAGDADKARRYFDRLIAEAPASGQTAKAREWMATGIVPKASGATCVGCHK